MRNVTGPYRTRYADVFRALGYYLDTSDFHDLTVVETSGGFVITGYRVTLTERGPAPELQSYLFADTDIEALIEQAFERRDAALPHRPLLAAVPVRDGRGRYEDVLRGIGTLIDERNWQAVTVVQTHAGFQVKGFHGDKANDTFLDAAALRKMLDELPSQRKRTWHKRFRW
ncbi:MAG TPA: hypothetical protein VMM78_02975 [Thermomicrobiales bacterium]|nr:hypothetical protein [Thermomicrobiales bacterium]